MNAGSSFNLTKVKTRPCIASTSIGLVSGSLSFLPADVTSRLTARFLSVRQLIKS